MTGVSALRIAEWLWSGGAARSNAGFTIVEMLVVIVIIGILTSSAVVLLPTAIDRARVRVCGSHIRHLQRLYDYHRVDTGSAVDNFEGLVQAGFLERVPSCPFGRATYIVNASGRVQCVSADCPNYADPDQ